MALMTKKVATRLLIVDDQEMVADHLQLILGKHADIDIRTVCKSSEALEVAVAFQPTVILQDLLMPEIDGFALLERYRENQILAHVPVVVLSATDDSKIKERSFLEGANDYLVKLPDEIELLARVRYHSAAYVARCERDESFHLLQISQKQLAAANIRLQALTELDSLTGIANRRRFDEVMAAEWGRCLRHQRPLAVLMCDIDHFKKYNDLFGHVSGDFCIKRTAAILTEQLRRPSDFVARYGGEEFVIVLPETDLAGALLVAEGCREQIENVTVAAGSAGLDGRVTISIGISVTVPSVQNDAIALIAAADQALYIAKHSGRNRIAHMPAN